jgi:hypothetical protein
VSKLNLKSRLETVSLGANLIATRLEAVEEPTDVIVRLVFFVGKFRIRPNLHEISWEASVLPTGLHTLWLISLSCSS